MTFDTTTIAVIVAVLAVLIVAFLLMRPRRQRIEREERESGEPYVASRERPYVRPRGQDGPQGNSVVDEVATATTDVAGDVLGVAVRQELPGARPTPDDFQRLKGVGPKLAARLNELGFTTFAQLAGLSDNEVAHLDERLGPFRGRLARDRVAEQAGYLARGDTDGFEERFGSLGG